MRPASAVPHRSSCRTRRSGHTPWIHAQKTRTSQKDESGTDGHGVLADRERYEGRASDDGKCCNGGRDRDQCSPGPANRNCDSGDNEPDDGRREPPRRLIHARQDGHESTVPCGDASSETFRVLPERLIAALVARVIEDEGVLGCGLPHFACVAIEVLITGPEWDAGMGCPSLGAGSLRPFTTTYGPS